jgi:hypothetical protein
LPDQRFVPVETLKDRSHLDLAPWFTFGHV